MKKQVIGAALAAALAAGGCTPAQAAGGIPAAGLMSGSAALLTAAVTAADTLGAPSAPPAQAVKKMGLLAVERTVRENSPTIQSLNKIATGVGSGSIPQADVNTIQSTINAYQGLVDGLKDARGSDEDSAIYIAYTEQIKVMEANIASLQTSLMTSAITGSATQTAYDDAEYSLRKQADNVTKQLCSGAESMLIGIQSLDYMREDLVRNLDALDRTLTVMEVQAERGMISPLELENAQNQRTQLAANLATLDNQREALGTNLALLCGYSADTTVEPSNLPEVSATELRSMKYEDDLEAALKNSYTLWVKKDAVRAAANNRDKNVSGTIETYEAAVKERDAAEEELTLAFKQAYDAVSSKKRLLDAAQFAVQKAEADLEVSQVKYEIGTVSKLDYQQAQDTLDAANNAVRSAKLDLLTAYRTYVWAKEGLITTSA